VHGRGSLVRAWVTAHDGLRGALALTTWTVLTLALSDHVVPVIGAQESIPLWMLYPTVAALLTSVVWSNGLAVTGCADSEVSLRSGLARLLWVIATMGVLWVQAELVGDAVDQPSLASATVLLGLLTCGLSSVLGVASVAVGAATLAILLIHAFAWSERSWLLIWESTPLPVRWAVLAVAFAGLLAYVVRGSNERLGSAVIHR